MKVPGVRATGGLLEVNTDEVTVGWGGGVWSEMKWQACVYGERSPLLSDSRTCQA